MTKIKRTSIQTGVPPTYGIPAVTKGREDQNPPMCGQGILTKLLGPSSKKNRTFRSSNEMNEQMIKAMSRQSSKSHGNIKNPTSPETDSTASEELFHMDDDKSSIASGKSSIVGGSASSLVSASRITQFDPQKSLDIINSCKNSNDELQVIDPNMLRNSKSLISWSHSLPSVEEEVDDATAVRRNTVKKDATPKTIPINKLLTPDESFRDPSPGPFHGIIDDDDDDVLFQDNATNNSRDESKNNNNYGALQQKQKLLELKNSTGNDGSTREGVLHQSSLTQPNPKDSSFVEPYQQVALNEDMNRALHNLLRQQQVSLKEMSLQNYHYRRELSECQSTFAKMKEERLDQQNQFDQLVSEKDSYEKEALWLRDELQSMRRELDALKRQPPVIVSSGPRGSSIAIPPNQDTDAITRLSYQNMSSSRAAAIVPVTDRQSVQPTVVSSQSMSSRATFVPVPDAATQRKAQGITNEIDQQQGHQRYQFHQQQRQQQQQQDQRSRYQQQLQQQWQQQQQQRQHHELQEKRQTQHQQQQRQRQRQNQQNHCQRQLKQQQQQQQQRQQQDLHTQLQLQQQQQQRQQQKHHPVHHPSQRQLHEQKVRHQHQLTEMYHTTRASDQQHRYSINENRQTGDVNLNKHITGNNAIFDAHGWPVFEYRDERSAPAVVQRNITAREREAPATVSRDEETPPALYKSGFENLQKNRLRRSEKMSSSNPTADF